MPPQPNGHTKRDRVFMIGVGGVSCSGKTTLAKHLRECLPDSFIVHQDDFAPPQENVPIHPVYGIQDWDDAPGAIVWPKMAKELAYVKSTGTVSDTHYSHDHLNAQKTMPIDEKVFQMWKDRFREIESRAKSGSGEKIQWVIVDGFLLYWSPEVYDELDVRLLLREPEPRVRARRLARSGYHTADGSLWRDPPNYWEQIVWPSYVRAHQGIFEGGDVEHGESNGKVRDLVVLHGETLTMTELFEKACEEIVESL